MATAGILICRCGGELERSLDYERLVALLKKNAWVGTIESIDRACTPEGMSRILGIAQKHGEAGILVAACGVDNFHQMSSRTVEEQGVPVQRLEVVPLRDWVFWNKPEPDPTAVANELITMGLRKLKTAKDTGHWNNRAASVNVNRCDKCKRCMQECPVEAYSFDDQGFPKSDPGKCQRCGVCVGSCPLQVVSLPHLRIEEISAALGGIKGKGSDEPMVVAFCCEPLSYPLMLQMMAQGVKLPRNLRTIKVPCVGAVNMALINDALSNGIDGTILMGCGEGPCPLRKGNALAQTRLKNLQETLGRMMLEPERVRYLPVSCFAEAPVEVDPNLCTGCLLCQQVCPFNAVQPMTENVNGKSRLVARRSPLNCRGCGICLTACPSCAASSREMSDASLLAAIDAACGAYGGRWGDPAVVLCDCEQRLNEAIRFSDMEENLRKLGISRVVHSSSACSEQGWGDIIANPLFADAKSVVIGACSPAFFLERWVSLAGTGNLSPGSPLTCVSLREDCAWQGIVPEQATDRAISLLQMAIAQSQEQKRCTVSQPDLYKHLKELGNSLKTYTEELRAIGPNPFKE